MLLSRLLLLHSGPSFFLPRYMSPEVFRHNPYNSKVDVYSFAMILYQMVELRSPFEGTDPVQAAFMAEAGRRPEWQLVFSLPFASEIMSIAEACWEVSARHCCCCR